LCHFTVELLNQLNDSYHHQIYSTIGLSHDELHQSNYLIDNTVYFKISHSYKHTTRLFFGLVFATVYLYMVNACFTFILLVLVELIWSLCVSIHHLIQELWTGNFVHCIQHLPTIKRVFLKMLWFSIVHVPLRILSILFHTACSVLSVTLKSYMKVILIYLVVTLWLVTGELLEAHDGNVIYGMLFATQRGLLVLTFAMSIDTYPMSWGSNLIFANTVWILYALILNHQTIPCNFLDFLVL